jgi:DNA-binding MarR family transcriptional regulator
LARDFADDLVASWAERRPDLDVTPVAITSRLARVRDHFEGEVAAVVGSFGLGAPSFVLLATLARLGPVPEARLAQELGLTAPTAAIRVDRLVSDGLVAREDAAVALTAEGQALVDRAVPAHLENLASLVAPLDASEQATLADLLRRLLVSFEG